MNQNYTEKAYTLQFYCKCYLVGLEEIEAENMYVLQSKFHSEHIDIRRQGKQGKQGSKLKIKNTNA